MYILRSSAEAARPPARGAAAQPGRSSLVRRRAAAAITGEGARAPGASARACRSAPTCARAGPRAALHSREAEKNAALTAGARGVQTTRWRATRTRRPRWATCARCSASCAARARWARSRSTSAWRAGWTITRASSTRRCWRARTSAPSRPAAGARPAARAGPRPQGCMPQCGGWGVRRCPARPDVLRLFMLARGRMALYCPGAV